MLAQSVMDMTMFDNTYGQRFVWEEEGGTHIKHYKVLIPTSMSNLVLTWATSERTLGLDEKVSTAEKLDIQSRWPSTISQNRKGYGSKTIY